MNVCQVCGNDIDPVSSTCPFCGSSQEPQQRTGESVLHKTVNLERGRPLIEQAVAKLQVEIKTARQERIKVVTFIHGYGSSGQGGGIRRECRKILDYLKTKGEIEGFIPGEEFSRKAGPVKSLLRRFPKLQENSNLNKENRGVTLVII